MARMIKKSNSKFTGYYLPEELLEHFQRLYPRLGTVFVRRCLIKACDDIEFFKDVYFTTEDKWSTMGSNNPDYKEL